MEQLLLSWGVYDKFIGSIHNLIFGAKEKKKEAFKYLIQLAVGWVIGRGLAVVILAALFQGHIYTVSSLFIGFIAGAIPLIVCEEKDSFRQVGKGILFGVLGAVLVAGITLLNGKTGSTSMDLGQVSISLGIQLFLIGMVAISAMFLPGISGSTLLLIFGAYIPVIHAVRGLLSLNFSYLPCLMIFGFGVLAGVVTVVKGIKVCLERFRVQSVYAILGMMIGSFYAIVQGPTTLENAMPALSLHSFQPTACIIGIVLVVGMQMVKERKN